MDAQGRLHRVGVEPRLRGPLEAAGGQLGLLRGVPGRGGPLRGPLRQARAEARAPRVAAGRRRLGRPRRAVALLLGLLLLAVPVRRRRRRHRHGRLCPRLRVRRPDVARLPGRRGAVLLCDRGDDPPCRGVLRPQLAHAQLHHRRMLHPLHPGSALPARVPAVAAHLRKEGRRHRDARGDRVVQRDAPPRRAPRGHRDGVGVSLGHERGPLPPDPPQPPARAAPRVVLRELHVLRHLPHGGGSPGQRLRQQRHSGGRRAPRVLRGVHAGRADRAPMDHRAVVRDCGDVPHPQRRDEGAREPVARLHGKVLRRGGLCDHHPLRR
mmetsp:Transcript_34455/g.81649  ORF Transcript_34455/g.81649 Transcript_34455/m.81649 type:complete len:323 (-) Transcript_34455:1316-2284(-)